MHSCFYGAFFFFGPGNQSVLMCAQTSSCHPAGGEKRGEKVFVESRVEAGYGICLLQMCLPCSLSHWGPKACMRVRHLGFFLGKQFYAKIRTVKNTLLCVYSSGIWLWAAAHAFGWSQYQFWTHLIQIASSDLCIFCVHFTAATHTQKCVFMSVLVFLFLRVLTSGGWPFLNESIFFFLVYVLLGWFLLKHIKCLVWVELDKRSM